MTTVRFHLLATLLLTLVGAARAADPALRPHSALDPVFTRQGVFSIPFRIDNVESGPTQPVEVRLSVSEDQGAKWRVESSVKPDQQAFNFRATHDGEYWFSIRTIDKQGQSHPEGPDQPQLRVVVDTVTPRLDLSAARGEGGAIVARWRVLDTGLKADSFKLEYQTAADDGWMPLAIDEQLQHAARYTLIGEATWWPPAGSGPVLLRATAADEAGNSAVSQVQIMADASGRPEPTPAGARRRSDRAVGDRPAPDHSAADRSARDNTASGRSLDWPADASTDQTLQRSAAGPADLATQRNSTQESPWRAAQRTGSGRAATTGVPAQMVAQSLPAAGGDGAADWTQMPLGERPRMVNLRSFELDYEVDAVGSSGVAKVELWGTRDGGRHWSNYGADNDNRSPLVVNVDGEGLYGFRVVIHSGNGLSGQSPRDGDLPEVWIGVDLTRPVARINGLDLTLDGGELAIRWEASDALLESRPISLSYSDQPRGPWTPIAAGLENTGSFHWRIDNRVPDRIYVRLEARDEAGNVGVSETPDPLSIDRQRPQGRIRGVRPLGQPAR